MFEKLAIALVGALITLYFYDQHLFERSLMTPISKGVYLSNWEAAVDESLLRKNEIKAVICINQRTKSSKELAKYQRLGIDSYEFALDDVPSAPINLIFDRTYQIMQDYISRGQTVLIHCTAGISRSATIVCMYLMRTYGLTMPQALKYIQKKRSVANPNPGFRNQLMLFAKR